MLLIFLPTHPHLLEGAQRAQDAASNPGLEAAIVGAEDFHFNVLWRNVGQLLLDSLNKALVHSITSVKYNVLEEVSSNINITLADGLHNHLMHSREAADVLLYVHDFILIFRYLKT